MNRDKDFRWRDGVSLREYIESRLDAIEKATTLAYDSMNKRLEGMNEFRDALKDQTGKFATRDEVKLVVDRLGEDVRGLRESKANLEGKASQQSVVAAQLLALIGIVLGAAGVIVTLFRS